MNEKVRGKNCIYDILKIVTKSRSSCRSGIIYSTVVMLGVNKMLCYAYMQPATALYLGVRVSGFSGMGKKGKEKVS